MHAASAVEHYQEVLKSSKEPALQDILGLAQALSLQKKYLAAVGTIETYLDRDNRDRLIRAILEICSVWQNELDVHKGADDLQRLQIAQIVLTYDPSNHEWQLNLLDLTGDKSLVRTSAMRLLEELAAKDAAGAEVNFFLGMEAYSREDFAAARTMLERSYAQMPGHPATANNLACAYLENPAPDPIRALKLADEAIAAAPSNPLFHETRGQVLVALGRWSDAVTELESDLAILPDRRRAHQLLAIAYDKLGQPEKAAEHKKQALTDHPQ
jgi:uncharacterized protein HemY